jgi:hypothetical protein
VRSRRICDGSQLQIGQSVLKDDKSKPIQALIDSNFDGKPLAMVFHLKELRLATVED